MRVQTLTLNDFQPLVEAIEEQKAAATVYYEKRNIARDLLNRILTRQQEGREQISTMLKELKEEEAALRRQVREDTNKRAKARMTGQPLPEMDNSAGARLAAIPDERAALEALYGVREMLPEEREEWEMLHSDASDAGDRLNRANKATIALLRKWRTYFEEESKAASLSMESARLADLEKDAYALNSNPASSEDEEEDDIEDSRDDGEECGGDWSVAYGRKAD